jgi:hypothetical protein
VTALPNGIYEALLDEELNSILQSHPELRSVFGKLDPEEEPDRYAEFVARVVETALRFEDDPATRLSICNQVVESLADRPYTKFLRNKRLLKADNRCCLK